jgi:hypothetical protein
MTRLEIMERWPVWFLRRVLAMRTFDREKPQLSPGLPDDIILFWEKCFIFIFIFYGHLVCFTAIWYILWPLGAFNGFLNIDVSSFGMLQQEKSGNPDCHREIASNHTQPRKAAEASIINGSPTFLVTRYRPYQAVSWIL